MLNLRKENRITGVILAGGNSKRMGKDKATLKAGDAYLIEYPVKILREVFESIFIITNSRLSVTLNKLFTNTKIEIFEDIYSGHGALGGIYTALNYTKTPYIFVTACDMPFINGNLIRYMNCLTDDYDVIIPESTHGLETLHAIYKKSLAEMIKINLMQNKNKIIDFFSQVNVYTIPLCEIKKFDNEENMFKNINTLLEFKENFS